MQGSNASPFIKISGKVINDFNEPYIIAEIGVNHEGSIDKAYTMIKAASEAGADAVKFQSYKAEMIASKNSPAYWDQSKEVISNQFELFKKFDCFNKEDYRKLAAYCSKHGVDFISTPFDLEAVEFIAPLSPCLKIASADITNFPLLRKIGSCSKPVLLSTGASMIEEIKEALEVLKVAGASEVALLHCVLNYPTANEDANIGMIKDLKALFPDHIIGYSDHTLPDLNMTALSTAYLFGALIIEKHFTYDKTLPGNDHYHAMDFKDLINFKARIKQIMELRGCQQKRPLDSEVKARLNARRSLVLINNLPGNTVLEEKHLICKRPGFGISAANFEEVVGLKTIEDLPGDHILNWKDLKREKEKITIIIQARMGSSRFPGKMMAKLAGYSILQWVLNRTVKTKKADNIILALPDGKENDILEEIAREAGVTAIRGSEDDVLSRFVKAARSDKTDIIIRVCADRPFICPDELDRLIDYYIAGRPDYAFNHINRLGNGYPDGLGGEIFSRAVLEDLNIRAVRQEHREHLTSYIWDNLSCYKVSTFKVPTSIAFPDIKLDIDYDEDFLYLQKLLNNAIENDKELSDNILNIAAEKILRSK